MKENKSGNASRPSAETHSASRRAASAASDAVFATMDTRAAEQFFARRGFSAETIEALVARGISMPEELLFMAPDQIQDIPFRSNKTALGEIRAYRKQFLGQNE